MDEISALIFADDNSNLLSHTNYTYYYHSMSRHCKPSAKNGFTISGGEPLEMRFDRALFLALLIILLACKYPCKKR